MNLLTARVVFWVVFAVGVKPISIVPENLLPGENSSFLMATESFLEEEGFLSGEISQDPALVVDFLAESLARENGFLTGDKILALDGEPVSVSTLPGILAGKLGERVVAEVARGEENLEISRICPEENCFLGVLLERTNPPAIEEIKFPVGQAAGVAARELRAQARLSWMSLGVIGRGLVSLDAGETSHAVNKLTGPVGAVKFGEMLMERGGRLAFLAFGGVISFALAFFNLLPIPALDGGRLLGVLIQAGFGLSKEKYFRVESVINYVFFALLLLLGIVIIFKDLAVFWGVSVFG